MNTHKIHGQTYLSPKRTWEMLGASCRFCASLESVRTCIGLGFGSHFEELPFLAGSQQGMSWNDPSGFL